ncbi:hypothetical protein [Falsigemmobacter faecalis]|nr:hypothetical protein [Falsigemmobacter faecalis]
MLWTILPQMCALMIACANSVHAVTLAMRRGLILNLPEDGESDDDGKVSD